MTSIHLHIYYAVFSVLLYLSVFYCCVRRRTLVMSMAGSRFTVTCSGQHPMPCCSLLWWALATTSPLCHCVSLPSPLLESCTLSEYDLIIRHGSVLAALFFANLGRGKRPRTQYPHVNCKPSSQALMKKRMLRQRALHH